MALEKDRVLLRLTKLCGYSFLSALLSACATAYYEPITEDYKGPTAIVSESSFFESRTKYQSFALTHIDGKLVRSVSGNAGPVTRAVPARLMKVTLNALIGFTFPYMTLSAIATGSLWSVAGEFDFTPEPGKRYVVKGEIREKGSSVWIEELDSGKIVTFPKSSSK